MGGEAGLQKLEEQVSMDAVALSNLGSGKPRLTLEVKGVKDNPRGWLVMPLLWYLI